MTPSERERRIEAGMRAWLPLGSPLLGRRVVACILDAADEAVPVVSEGIVDEMVWLRRERQKCDLETAVAAAYERGVTDGLYRAGLEEDEVALLRRSRPGEEGTEG